MVYISHSTSHDCHVPSCCEILHAYIPIYLLLCFMLTYCGTYTCKGMGIFTYMSTFLLFAFSVCRFGHVQSQNGQLRDLHGCLCCLQDPEPPANQQCHPGGLLAETSADERRVDSTIPVGGRTENGSLLGVVHTIVYSVNLVHTYLHTYHVTYSHCI